MQLLHLLQNLFNAPWPKNFDATAFGEMDIIESDNIKAMREPDQIQLADYILERNEGLKNAQTPFYFNYIFSIQRWADNYAKELLEEDQMDEWDRLS